MRSFFLAGVFVLLFLCLEQSANAQEVMLPAGTLLNCTLNEPNLSSASAQAGDPVICHTRGLQQFGHAVFPRGVYLAGHLIDSKDPGHFSGKGWLLRGGRLRPTARPSAPSGNRLAMRMQTK